MISIGMIKQRTTETRGQGIDVDYDYDSLDNLTNSVLVLDNPATNNLTTAYSYDSVGRLNSIQSEGPGQTQTFSYASVPLENRLSAVTNEITGVVTSYEYDGFNRVTNISYTASDDSLIRSVAYEYDSTGMITNRVIDDGSQSTAIGYQYDNLGRLYKETACAYTNEFLYDLAGNRTQTVDATSSSRSTNVYTLGSGNKLASVTTDGSETQIFDYDGAGSTILISNSTREVTLEWDERHRLTNSTVLTASTTSTVSYAYDVFGRRISRVESGTTNYFVYSGSQIAADIDEDGDLIRSYTYGPGIDNILSMTVYSGSTNTYYYLKDIQNSVIALTDESGDVVESYEYDAYGNTTVYDENGTEISESAYGNRYCFQGREIDWTTGLYYFRARWYNPETGRWLSKDPIGISGGLNLYAFCGNNPVNMLDPSGLDSVGYTVGGAYAVGGRVGDVVAGGGFGGGVTLTLNDQGDLTLSGQVTRENGLRLSGGAGPQVTLDKYDGGTSMHNVGLVGGTITGNAGSVTYTHGKFDVGYSYSELLGKKEGTINLGPLGRWLWDKLFGDKDGGDPCKK